MSKLPADSGTPCDDRLVTGVSADGDDNERAMGAAIENGAGSTPKASRECSRC